MYNLLEETESLFSEYIRMEPMPPRLKLPNIKYDETGDLAEHLERLLREQLRFFT